MNVWPGVAPGSEQWKQPETVLGAANNRRIVNVTTPTLSVYLPAPSKATGTAVIIAPGGGFVGLSIDSEGHDVAKWLVERGFAAIVLKYRLVQIEGQDAAQLNQAAGARFGAQLRNLALIDEDGQLQLGRSWLGHAQTRQDERPLDRRVLLLARSPRADASG